ncbi:hypothetical protein [Halorubrum tibetense]|uniref:Uncharacterized protein n=1 Tax=Halorubrum tibetense TaxID=175631 RepID=A0ABD5S7Y4_9EURY
MNGGETERDGIAAGARGCGHPVGDDPVGDVRVRGRVVTDTRALVRSDERVLLVFLLLLSLVALSVFLHYVVSLLGSLPEVPPSLVVVR